MPASAAKAPHAPALEMRLSVPADGNLKDVATELAAKIAEFLGADSPSMGAAIGTLTSRVASAGENVTFEFRHVGRELVIRAHCNGRSAEERRPLTA